MKAPMSDLARAVLADPKATQQLRAFLATRGGRYADGDVGRIIEVEFQGRKLRLKPTFVPKPDGSF